MGYQRANWNSGLTYQQTCEYCKHTFRYTDRILDFRPWYADGYVDCPNCKSHLRHNEKYALNAPKPQEIETPPQEVAPNPTAQQRIYCTNCGNKFDEGANFCAYCGNKRN